MLDGGSAENRARIVVEVIRAVRAATADRTSFAVGVKVNSADHQDEADGWIMQLRQIVEAGVDFIEVSGGTYENPTMSTGLAHNMAERSARTAVREAFFLEFAGEVRRAFPEVSLIVTGGFRSRTGMEAAVAGRECDMVGLGRPAVLNPLLPKTVVFNSEVQDADATLYVRKLRAPWWLRFLGIRAIGAGIESVSCLFLFPKCRVVLHGADDPIDMVYQPDEGSGEGCGDTVATCAVLR